MFSNEWRDFFALERVNSNMKHLNRCSEFTCRWCWSCCAHSRWCCRCSACPAGPAAACWSYCQTCRWWLQSLRLTGGRPHTRPKTEAVEEHRKITGHAFKPKAAAFRVPVFQCLVGCSCFWMWTFPTAHSLLVLQVSVSLIRSGCGGMKIPLCSASSSLPPQHVRSEWEARPSSLAPERDALTSCSEWTAATVKTKQTSEHKHLGCASFNQSRTGNEIWML